MSSGLGDFDMSTKKKKTKKKSSSGSSTPVSVELPPLDNETKTLFENLKNRKKKSTKQEKQIPSELQNVDQNEEIDNMIETIKNARVTVNTSTLTSAIVGQNEEEKQKEIQEKEAKKQQQKQQEKEAVIESNPEEVPEMESIDIKVGSEVSERPIEQDERDTVEGEEGPDAWVKSERDYTYSEMLNRLFNTLRQRNPEMAGGRAVRHRMKPPIVLRDGSKKTVFANLSEICSELHRQPEHLLAFILAELGTSGNLDGSNRLIVRGRFQPAQIESLIRKYVAEYVVCGMCRSLDTSLVRDNQTRLYSLQCSACGASRTVQTIKGGYLAQTRRRR
eukprot:gb/GECH01012115.1/.p1 GENE.gb/GECH01012115.1/~~gb/GECH01012115.1/.p1  ORF type:complete len:333 (+),score=109.79 gb/GECH01012115.1/:1-999(+)